MACPYARSNKHDLLNQDTRERNAKPSLQLKKLHLRRLALLQGEHGEARLGATARTGGTAGIDEQRIPIILA